MENLYIYHCTDCRMHDQAHQQMIVKILKFSENCVR